MSAQPPNEPQAGQHPSHTGRPSHTSHAGPRPWARRLRLAALCAAGLLGLPLALGAAAWVWSGSEGSLATTLNLLPRWLPADRQLQLSGVSGTLREGGQIAELQWAQPGTQATLTGLHIRWDWRALLSRHLALSELSAERLTLRDHGKAPPSPPLTELTLPLTIDTPLQLGEIQLPDQGGLVITHLDGHYHYDGEQHHLQWSELGVAAGHYSGQVSLQGAAPMALQAQLEGEIPTQLGAPAPAQLLARAGLQGTLSGPAAEIALEAVLDPDGAPPPTAGATTRQGRATTPGAMQAQVQARLRPWAEQVLPEAQAHLQGIDLSLLWPQAPSTALSGTIDIHPGDGQAPAWQARLDLRNAQPGPWDQQRLPLEQLSARLQQQGRAWVIDPVEARLGGGTLRLKGRWEAGSTTPWLTEATLQGVSPQRLHSAAPPAPLNGHLALRALGGQADALGFEVDLSPQASGTARTNPSTPQAQPQPQPQTKAQARTEPAGKAAQARTRYPAATAAKAPPAPGQALWTALQLRQAQAQGRWQGGELQLQQLKLELAEARLEGSLQWATGQRQGRADLKLQTPGLNAVLQGHLGADQGQGQWQAQLSDAGALGRWLAHLPGLGSTATALPQQGQGQFDGQWQGGWGAMLAAWQGQAAPRRGQALSLSTRLDLPRLDWAATDQRPALALRQLQLRLNGTLPGSGNPASNPPATPPLELSLSGEARQGARQARLQVSAHAGPSASNPPGAFNWAARLDELSLNLQDSATAAPWGLRLSAPATLSLNHQAKADLTELTLAPGEARLAHAGVPDLSLRWQNTRWAQQKGQARWQTSGQVQDLSLPWIEQLMTLAQGASSASLGISGDLLLNADWSASAEPGLKARLRLSRQRGDLRLQAEDLPQGVQANEAQRSAGARVAEATLSLDEGALSAAVQWDSERAGQLQARFNTRLSNGPQGLSWPPDTALSGSLNAQMPKLGVWSVLAPPGWRMRGTLDAQATLKGTLQNPEWQGEIRASDLALRSVVEGVELRDGKLRAVLSGHQIDITEFTLRGAPGAGGDGGSLSAQGSAHWNGQQLQLQLQTRANRLRVSSRADRRLALSGELNTRLEQGQLKVSGNLKADQALFILPDETAPSLGADVLVQPGRHGAGQASHKTASQTANQATPPAPQPPSALPAADVQVSLDLGNDFRVQGRGLVTRLRGSLKLRLSPGSTEPQITGELRTDQGTYKAYGQQLNIETGVLRFSGAYDNPSLDILAIRPNLSTRVGVQISGTVLSPRVRLFSEPEMADADKLAWLVLGRAAANGAAESALLQQAALALLGGGRGLSDSLAQSLGLDEVSFSGVKNTDTGVTSAALTLGKRLSKDFYVSYERSLAGTMGTFYIFYDLTRRFTLRAQTGEKSAVDLIFTLSYD